MSDRELVSQVKIDEIDVKILKALLEDARTNFADIARDCGVSTTSIVKRFYNLKRCGIIAGTSIRVDLNKMGYNLANRNDTFRILGCVQAIMIDKENNLIYGATDPRRTGSVKGH